jgi:hypothetical protein
VMRAQASPIHLSVISNDSYGLRRTAGSPIFLPL